MHERRFENDAAAAGVGDDAEGDADERTRLQQAEFH